MDKEKQMNDNKKFTNEEKIKHFKGLITGEHKDYCYKTYNLKDAWKNLSIEELKEKRDDCELGLEICKSDLFCNAWACQSYFIKKEIENRIKRGDILEQIADEVGIDKSSPNFEYNLLYAFLKVSAKHKITIKEIIKELNE